MNVNFNKLTNLQKDALKEVGNIGAGNAATAFAQLLDCKIEMTVPSVEILPITKVPEVTGNMEEKVVGILLEVLGEAPGNILFILTEKSIKHLIILIMNKNIDIENMDEVEISALKEIGNILSGSYLNSLNQLTGYNLTQSVPGFAYDMAGAILSTSMVSLSESSDYVFLIETVFIDDGEKIEGYFFLIPEMDSLNKILSALGLDVK